MSHSRFDVSRSRRPRGLHRQGSSAPEARGDGRHLDRPVAASVPVRSRQRGFAQPARLGRYRRRPGADPWGGDSPHSFDDLAPAFTEGHRVIAYARRGHGHSDYPATGPYENETLVEDLHQLLDSLGIKRAVLGGWSMGGNEITRFAERYPDRAAGIIYFEAGYDWSDSAMVRLLGSLPIPLSPTPADLESFPAYRSWWGRWHWPNGTLTASAEAGSGTSGGRTVRGLFPSRPTP